MPIEIMLFLTNPDQYVATCRNGEIYIEPATIRAPKLSGALAAALALLPAIMPRNPNSSAL